MEVIQASKAKMDSLVEELKTIQRDIGKAVNDGSSLNAQLTENTLVKKELSLLEDDGKVYKMVGPVLIKQDLNEARSNVDKRIEFITTEIKRADERTKGLEEKQGELRKKIMEGQQNLQKLVAQITEKKQ
eukprot:Plantae.Rhodophyta-Hildenbrandia_rubra.ctg15568.p1 GENE.Plantae.Rhodophyta-Hildenbrandia_rubra.ctg15568~~Plantae.Rhodophyta-Hildenbrandia_rubra.ctg15568.p1  ORF type:complete len:130 (-),score=36.40 Plantae.Rhodophyta-Hildenbrandia_rubra.ctg15568:312-701(-)